MIAINTIYDMTLSTYKQKNTEKVVNWHVTEYPLYCTTPTLLWLMDTLQLTFKIRGWGKKGKIYTVKTEYLIGYNRT
jgi:hypothetical protein